MYYNIMQASGECCWNFSWRSCLSRV